MAPSLIFNRMHWSVRYKATVLKVSGLALYIVIRSRNLMILVNSISAMYLHLKFLVSLQPVIPLVILSSNRRRVLIQKKSPNFISDPAVKEKNHHP